MNPSNRSSDTGYVKFCVSETWSEETREEKASPEHLSESDVKIEDFSSFVKWIQRRYEASAVVLSDRHGFVIDWHGLISFEEAEKWAGLIVSCRAWMESAVKQPFHKIVLQHTDYNIYSYSYSFPNDVEFWLHIWKKEAPPLLDDTGLCDLLAKVGGLDVGDT